MKMTMKMMMILSVLHAAGRIGREVASRCRQGFGMSTIGYDPVLSEAAARAADIDLVSLDELFEKSDFITIHTPLTESTKYLIDAQTLAQCKKGVRIINCARGGVVHEGDLLAAVQSGMVGGVSLDTFEVEPPEEASYDLRMHPNVIVTPHLGASTTDAQVRPGRLPARSQLQLICVSYRPFICPSHAVNMSLFKNLICIVGEP